MFCKEPILIVFTAYMSLSYGILYLTFVMYPFAFVSVRGWDPIPGSLPFLGLFIGICIACIIIAMHSLLYVRPRLLSRGRLQPEDRLPPMIFGSVCLTGGLFWFAWTSSPDIHWLNQHTWSQFRHLPAPKQGFALLRIFHEPGIEEIERWIDTIPNKGLIRYHGSYNRQRLLVTSPSGARDLLHTSAYKFIKPSLQHFMAGQVAGEGLLLLEGEEHKQAKKAFAHSFQPQRVNNVYPMFYKMASKMQDWVGQQAKDDPESRASVLKPVSAATLDAVGQWAYSKDFKALSNPRERFPRSYVEMLKMTPRGQFFLSLVALIDPWVMKLPVRAAKTITGVVQFVIKTSAEIVDEREKLFEKNKNGEPDSEIPDDMLSSIMKTNHFSHVELINETVHFLAASTETSAGSICWAVHLLSRHMHVQNRLREEIRTDLPSPKMVHDGLVDEDRVSYKVFDNMPYLHAVAKEVFRFHSINSLLWRECVEPATVAGEDITIGTQVVFSPWAAGRDPKHWGPDARQLRPERWLESPSGGADDSYAFLTFGASARRCIGEQYAYAQFKTFLAALVGKFEFKTMDVTGTDVGTEIGSNYPLTLFKIMDGWKSYVREIDGW